MLVTWNTLLPKQPDYNVHYNEALAWFKASGFCYIIKTAILSNSPRGSAKKPWCCPVSRDPAALDPQDMLFHTFTYLSSSWMG